MFAFGKHGVAKLPARSEVEEPESRLVALVDDIWFPVRPKTARYRLPGDSVASVM